MKKLIAQRPILYLGRSYERGTALPANDSLMTAAWLKAGSAAWAGDEVYEDVIPPVPGAPVDGALPEERPPAQAKKGRKR